VQSEFESVDLALVTRYKGSCNERRLESKETRENAEMTGFRPKIEAKLAGYKV
jgi:hypothetical protein